MSSAPLSRERFDPLDVLRGVAMIWMAVYHLFFDLNHFRLFQRPLPRRTITRFVARHGASSQSHADDARCR